MVFYVNRVAILTSALFIGLSGFVSAAERIECEALRKMLDENKKVVLVDVRSQADYELSHIAGAVSVPFNKLPAEAKWPKKTPLVLYCSGVGCPLSNNSALALVKEGYKDVKVLRGGMAEWELKEYPMAGKTANLKIPPSPPLPKGGDKRNENYKIPPGLLLRPILRSGSATEDGQDFGGQPPLAKGGIEKNGKGTVILLDSRAEMEFLAGHPKGAVNIPLEKIEQGVGTLPAGAEIVVCDRSAERSARAVSILNKAGFPARAFSGGIAAWSAKGSEMAIGKKDSDR